MSYWKDENVNDLRKGCVRLLLEKLTASYVVKKKNAFYGNWKFITIFELLITVLIQMDPVHILAALRLLVSIASLVSKCL
jgi:hypothetical protein